MAQSKSVIKQHARWLTSWLHPLWQIGPASQRMALSLFLWGVGEGMWMYIRPLYISELGGNPVQVGQVLSIAGLAPVLLMLPVGRLTDKVGPRLLLIVMWWLGTIATVILALASNWLWVIPGFFFYDMSGAALPAINAYVAQEVQFSSRRNVGDIQSVISIVFAGYIAGTIFSPVVGGWVGEQFGLAAIFWVSSGWFLLSVLAVMSLPRLPWPQAQTNAAAAKDAIPWWRFSAVQIRIYVIFLVLFFVMALGYILVPQYLEDVRVMSLGGISSLGAATALGGFIWMLILGRQSSRNALTTGSLLMALAFVGLVFLPAYGQFWSMALVYFLLGIYLTVRTVSLGVVSEITPLEQRGTSYSMVEMVYRIGAFLGPLCAGVLYSITPTLPFLIAAVILVLWSGVVWLALHESEGANPA